MVNNCKITEKIAVNVENLPLTSAAGATSVNYDMQNFDRAAIAVCVRGTYSSVVIDLMESSGATVGGSSAAASKAGIVLGGNATNIPSTGGVRQILLTHDAGTTSETVYFGIGSGGLKAFTYTSSTALLNSSAWTSTAFYYGSTVASSANTGSQLAMDALKTALVSTIGFGPIFDFSTPATNTLGIRLHDSATGNLKVNTTVAIPTWVVNQAVGAFEIEDANLNSTANKRYIGLKCGTVSTGVGACAISVMRTGGYGPAAFGGHMSS